MRNPDAAAHWGRGEPERQAEPAHVVVARRGQEGVERPRSAAHTYPRRPDRLLGPSTASPHAVWKL